MLKCQHLPPPEGRLICPLPWGSLLSLNCIYPAKYHKSKFPFGYGETLPSHPSKHSVCFQVERHRFHLPSSSSSSRVCFQDSIPLLCSWRKRGIERERGSEFFVLDKVCSLLPFPTYLPTSSSRKMPGVCLLWRSSNQALEGKGTGKGRSGEAEICCWHPRSHAAKKEKGFLFLLQLSGLVVAHMSK